MSKAVPKTGDIVEIHWIDSIGGDGWQHADKTTPEHDKIYLPHKSVGYLHYRTDKAVCIYQSTSVDRPDAMVDHRLTIPVCAVTKIKKL